MICILIFQAWVFQPNVSLIPFAKYPNQADASYFDLQKSSFYIPMRDGTEIAVDLILPKELKPGQKIPTLVEQTRYWRDYQVRGIVADKTKVVSNTYAERGYAVLLVDVRGTGASFGWRPHPWSEKELQDCFDIAEWIVQQPWSNGRIGAHGVSYSGTSAALMAACGHPAVKVVIPQFFEFDVYTDIAFPGGIFHENFVRQWSQYNQALDANKVLDEMSFFERWALRGVAPVDGPQGSKLRKKAVAEHRQNADVFAAGTTIDSRDDTWGDSGVGMDQFSLHRRNPAIQESGAFLNPWGSWMDAGTAQAVLHLFANSKRPVRAVIGAWNHGAESHASPFGNPGHSPNPGPLGQAEEMQRVLDSFLLEKGPIPAVEEGLIYYTMGEERWHFTNTWPPADVEPKRFYLNPAGRLETRAETGTAMDYEVDFEATTGQTNRWTTQLGGPVTYPDRGEADKRCLVFDSDPLEQTTEITGHPTLHLSLETSAEDGAFYCYLEAITPDGKVLYLSEGQLRGVYREQLQNPPYRTFNVAHNFSKTGRKPMVPGKMTTLDLAILPTSVILPKGYRLRVALAGNDQGNFERIPKDGPVQWRIPSGLSSLVLPTKPRPDLDFQSSDSDHISGNYQFANGASLSLEETTAGLTMSAANQDGLALFYPTPSNLAQLNQNAQLLLEALQEKNLRVLEGLLLRPHRAKVLSRSWRKIVNGKKAHLVGTIQNNGQPLSLIQIQDGTSERIVRFYWHPTLAVLEGIGGGNTLPHRLSLSPTGPDHFAISQPGVYIEQVRLHWQFPDQDLTLQIGDHLGKKSD